MPVFEVERGGKTFEIEAPDENTAAAGFTHYSGQTEGITGYLGDMLQSFGRGVVKGGIGLSSTPGNLREAVTSRLPEEDQGAAVEAMKGIPFIGKVVAQGPTTQQTTSAVESVTGKFEKPRTTGGKYAESVGEFAAGSAITGGGLIPRIMSTIMGGLGAEGAVQATGTEGSGAEPYMRMAGGVGGMAAPGIAARAITPFPTSTARQTAVKTLEQEGVTDLTAGQKTGNRFVRYAESELGNLPFAGGKAFEKEAAASEQFTNAVLKRVGETKKPDEKMTEVVDRAFRRIGGDFDKLEKRNTLQADAQYAQNLNKIAQDYEANSSAGARAPIINNVVDDLLGRVALNKGRLEGTEYKKIRTRIDEVRRETADSGLANALMDIRQELDATMERSIAKLNPADLGAWKEARRQYRNMLIIEKASTGAGEKVAAGALTPAKVRQALVAQSRREYARGQGDFNELVHAGEELLSPLPQSGTTPRWVVHGFPSAIGAGLGHLAGGNISEAATVAGAVAGPGIAGRGLMTDSAQWYLANQGLAGLIPKGPNLEEMLVRSGAAAESQ